MVKVVVTGIGLLSCIGNLRQTWHNLINLKSGIKTHQIFANFPDFPLGLIGKNPIKLDNLTKIIVQQTLKDANLKVPLIDCGVVIGSSRSCQAIWEVLITQLYQQNYAHFIRENKINWLHTLPSQPAQLTASLLQTKATVFAPMAACSTGIWAIAQGYELIQQGICNRVIVGAVETPITQLTLAGFDKIGALAKTECYPFDKNREGFVLAEGGAMLILETAELALSRGASIYGQILGFAMSCDATHISTPEASGENAISTINKCLQRSNLNTTDIDYIHAHGTGTKLNDAREAKIIQALFPFNIAVSSTKGATGHTLGASSAIATALSLMAIKQQQLPPNIGLKEAEFKLNLVTNSVKISIKNTLCFSFGFGGQNAVLALGNFKK